MTISIRRSFRWRHRPSASRSGGCPSAAATYRWRAPTWAESNAGVSPRVSGWFQADFCKIILKNGHFRLISWTFHHFHQITQWPGKLRFTLMVNRLDLTNNKCWFIGNFMALHRIPSVQAVQGAAGPHWNVCCFITPMNTIVVICYNYWL